jgi:hypothetical protein
MSVPDACESCRDAVLEAAANVVDARQGLQGATVLATYLNRLGAAVEQSRRCRSTTGHDVAGEFDSKMEGVRMVRDAMRRHGLA